MDSLQKKIEQVFHSSPEMIFGFTDIAYSKFGKEYPSALVFVVPYTDQLSLRDYKEDKFHEGILGAKANLEKKVAEIETLLRNNGIRFYTPEVAQKDDGQFRAEFSFKDAAAAAGIGWFGKNDVIITERYGPRIRLSAILIDHKFEYGRAFEKCRCPEDCEKCISICPGHALLNTSWKLGMTRDDIIDIARCNKIRSSFYPRLGRWGACALCLAVCPYGMAKEKISKAGLEDLEKILELQYLAYQSEAALFGTMDIPPLKQTLEEVEQEYREGLILKMVSAEDVLIGSVRAREEGETVYIGKLMVHPKYRGQGLGTRLLQEIERQLPGKRYELFTSTRSGKNIQMYKKNGYQIFRQKEINESLVFVYMEKRQ